MVTNTQWSPTAVPNVLSGDSAFQIIFPSVHVDYFLCPHVWDN